jgi:NAD(P)-dependent dehydrogenase (short-subunit alcohol dehydrogenase family)
MGSIVNLASDTVNLVLPGFTHYVASKAGVIGFTRSLATEYGQSGITANAIAPGLTRTPGTEAREEIAGGMSREEFFVAYANMQAIKRVQEVSDLVGVVSFLARAFAVFVTARPSTSTAYWYESNGSIFLLGGAHGLCPADSTSLRQRTASPKYRHQYCRAGHALIYR